MPNRMRDGGNGLKNIGADAPLKTVGALVDEEFEEELKGFGEVVGTALGG